jgi:hypothetical protein
VNWREHLLDTLRRLQPQTLCTLDSAAHDLARQLFDPARLHAFGGPGATRCSLALGIDALNGLDRRQGLQLLAQVRTYAAPAVLIAAQPGCTLDASEFRALGFVVTFTDSAEKVTLYEYDIATYKPVPDWLNARFWAHPERWER